MLENAIHRHALPTKLSETIVLLLPLLLVLATIHPAYVETSRVAPLPPKDALIKWEERDSHDDNRFIIPYKISGHFSRSERDTIEMTMAEIESNTCLRFTLRHHERYYTDIRNEKGKGCLSGIGAQADGAITILNLESPSEHECTKRRSVVHELLHVVGLGHEHSRYDANNYIVVHFENIDERYQGFFRQESYAEANQDLLTFPYDYLSVMHYHKNDFASPPWAIAIETLNPLYQDLIGTGETATPGDYAKVRALYKCMEVPKMPVPPTAVSSREGGKSHKKSRKKQGDHSAPRQDIKLSEEIDALTAANRIQKSVAKGRQPPRGRISRPRFKVEPRSGRHREKKKHSTVMDKPPRWSKVQPWTLPRPIFRPEVRPVWPPIQPWPMQPVLQPAIRPFPTPNAPENKDFDMEEDPETDYEDDYDELDDYGDDYSSYEDDREDDDRIYEDSYYSDGEDYDEEYDEDEYYDSGGYDLDDDE